MNTNRNNVQPVRGEFYCERQQTTKLGFPLFLLRVVFHLLDLVPSFLLFLDVFSSRKRRQRRLSPILHLRELNQNLKHWISRHKRLQLADVTHQIDT